MKREGFTLIELLVVLAILGLLAAILFPVFAKVRENGRRTVCQSNLKQIALAMQQYVQDNSGAYPPALTREHDWAGMVFSYAPDKDVFHCPSCPVPDAWNVSTPSSTPDTAQGYAMNSCLYDMDTENSPFSTNQVRFPASTVLVCEFAYRAGPQPGETAYPSALLGPDDGAELQAGQSFIGPAGALRHRGGSNYVFVDGHVRWYAPQQVSRSKQGNEGMRPSFAL